MSDTVLDVRNLRVQFYTDETVVEAVNDISFQVKRGQTLGIVGESGSGKSVTSLAVMGLIPQPPGKISGGEIWFDDRDGNSGTHANLLQLSQSQMQPYRGGRISMIFQEPLSALNPVYDIGFQLTEAIRLHQQVPQAEARRQAIARLQEVKLLPDDEQLRQQATDEFKQESPDGQPSDRDIAQAVNRRKQDILNRYPHELSGGQIQRVTIAMAIACDPTLLIADEPTTALDVTVQAAILNLLREIRDRRGMSMIFITHDLSVIAEIADDVAVMYQGEIVEAASVWQIFSDPQHPYTKGLLACRPQPDKRLKYLPTIADFMAKVAEDRNNPTTSDALPDTESLVDEREVSTAELDERSRSLQAQSPLLSVNDLQVGFPIRGMFGGTERYFMAVNGVSFQVYPGETLGVVGESGCGKTTLARTLLRLIDPIGGQIWFEGAEISHLEGNALRHLRRDMQVIFQDPFSSLNPRMTIGAAVIEPLKIHGVGKSRKQQRDRAADLLDRVGIDPNSMNRYPHEFSGGQRQRICIARALALNPKFVICDESVSALDVSVQAQVLNLLKALQQEFGLTYIFISHDLSVVKFMSDRILVMNRGKIEEIDAAERVYRQPQQPYTRQLIASIPTGSLERIRQLQEMR